MPQGLSFSGVPSFGEASPVKRWIEIAAISGFICVALSRLDVELRIDDALNLSGTTSNSRGRNPYQAGAHIIRMISGRQFVVFLTQGAAQTRRIGLWHIPPPELEISRNDERKETNENATHQNRSFQ